MSLFKKEKIGLALGSGAARGLAHIGVLKVLDDHKVKIQYIAGSSMGAFVGALYATGLSGRDIESIALELDWKLTAKLFAPTLPYDGLVAGNTIRDYIKTLVGDIDIEELDIPYAAIATDLMSGEEIVIKRGSLVEAVRASVSIPGVFTPVKNEGRYLVDGGVTNPVPVDVVQKMGATSLIAVAVRPPRESGLKDIKLPGEKKERKKLDRTPSSINQQLSKIFSKADHNPVVSFVEHLSEKKEKLSQRFSGPNLVETILQSIGIMEIEIMRSRFEKYPPDLLIQPEVEQYTLADFTKAKELIALGEKEAQKALADF